MAAIGKVIGVAGCTNAGKTTIARMIAELVSESVSRLDA
jgi:uridine kinase